MSPPPSLTHLTKREALEQLVERSMTEATVLLQCRERLEPQLFSYDYDLRIIFFALCAWWDDGRYRSEDNADLMARSMGALEAREHGDIKQAAANAYGWECTFNDWYCPFTVIPEYVEALIAAVEDMDQRESDAALVMRDYFAFAPLAVDKGLEDAVWDRIREAVAGRRAIDLAKAAPRIPRPVQPVSKGDRSFLGTRWV